MHWRERATLILKAPFIIIALTLLSTIIGFLHGIWHVMGLWSPEKNDQPTDDMPDYIVVERRQGWFERKYIWMACESNQEPLLTNLKVKSERKLYVETSVRLLAELLAQRREIEALKDRLEKQSLAILSTTERKKGDDNRLH